MANYRSIHTKMWCDPTLEDLSADARYLFVYLITNPHRNESGLYSISLRKMGSETGLGDRAAAALDELQKAQRVFWDDEKRTIWVVNIAKHQKLNPNCIKSINSDLARCSSQILLQKFCEYYKDHKGLSEICKPLISPLPTPTEGFISPPTGSSTGYRDRVQGEGESEGGAPPAEIPTLDTVLTHCAHPTVSIEKQFAEDWYKTLFAAGWKDGDGRTVVGWKRYLTKSWAGRDPDWRQKVAARSKRDQVDSIAKESPPGGASSPRTPHEQAYLARIMAGGQVQGGAS